MLDVGYWMDASYQHQDTFFLDMSDKIFGNSKMVIFSGSSGIKFQMEHGQAPWPAHALTISYLKKFFYKDHPLPKDNVTIIERSFQADREGTHGINAKLEFSLSTDNDNLEQDPSVADY